MNNIDKLLDENELAEYTAKLIACKENLIARFINETGYKPSEICIVEVRDTNSTYFFPDVKKNYNFNLPKETTNEHESTSKENRDE